jgi:hypothetical protein
MFLAISSFVVNHTMITNALKKINTLKFQNTWTRNYNISKFVGKVK